MAVGAVDVEVFQLRRRRQHDVGIVGRVGLELLVDDGEQVLASQALQHAGLIGADRGGVGVVDVQCAHRRPGQVALQASASCDHVDGARPGGNQVGPFQPWSLNGYSLLVLSRAPPPDWRQAPMTAGKQVMVRTAMPPPPWRCRP